jgi:hypothetical protein
MSSRFSPVFLLYPLKTARSLTFQPFNAFNPEFALGIPEIIGGRVNKVKK